MNNNCDKIKTQIIEFIADVIAPSEIPALEQHLSQCQSCREYAELLQKEERLLVELFAKIRSDESGREEEIINAIERVNAAGRFGIISARRTITKSAFARLTAMAAVVVFVTAYFAITLAWISEIKECIRLCS